MRYALAINIPIHALSNNNISIPGSCTTFVAARSRPTGGCASSAASGAAFGADNRCTCQQTAVIVRILELAGFCDSDAHSTLGSGGQRFSSLNKSGILRDKTMEDKLMNVYKDERQNLSLIKIIV